MQWPANTCCMQGHNSNIINQLVFETWKMPVNVPEHNMMPLNWPKVRNISWYNDDHIKLMMVTKIKAANAHFCAGFAFQIRWQNESTGHKINRVGTSNSSYHWALWLNEKIQNMRQHHQSYNSSHDYPAFQKKRLGTLPWLSARWGTRCQTECQLSNQTCLLRIVHQWISCQQTFCYLWDSLFEFSHI